MTLQQNTNHIQTTHIGSLPRPHALLDLLKAKYSGLPHDDAEFNAVLTRSVAECVKKQVESGIEIVTDGEFSKRGFFTYIRERFDSFESRPNQKLLPERNNQDLAPGRHLRFWLAASGIRSIGAGAHVSDRQPTSPCRHIGMARGCTGTKYGRAP